MVSVARETDHSKCARHTAGRRVPPAGPINGKVVMLRLRNVTFTSPDPRRLADFWSAVLGLRERRDRAEEVLLAGDGWGFPRFSFQRTDRPPAHPSAVHLDLTARDRVTEVDRLVRLGATEVRTVADQGGSGLTWTVLQDPDGNEFCVTSEPDTPGRADA